MIPSTLTEGKFQDQGNLDQYLEEWLYPIGSQPNCDFFSEKDKQESTRIEGLDSEGATISKQDPEGAISTTVVVKWSEKVEGTREKIYYPL